MRRASLLMVSLLIGCGGCAVVKRTYEEPASGPTANVEFGNETTGESWLWLYVHAARCSGRRHAGPIDASDSRDLAVRANKELALSFGYTISETARGRATCQVTVSFVPKARTSYVAILFANRSKKKCYLYVGVKDPSVVGGSSPISTKKRVFQAGFDENSDFCQPGGAEMTVTRDGTSDKGGEPPPRDSGPVRLEDLKGLLQK